MLKRCTKCGEEKPATPEFFYRDKSLKCGLRPRCAICEAARTKIYHSRPEYHEERRAYREANKERERARTRTYYEANKEHLRQMDKIWSEANKGRIQAAERKRRYGISAEQWDAIYRVQGGCCALCRVDLSSLPAKAIHVDHCHATNKMRGILCHDCNTALGKLGDTAESIMRVYQYLIGNLYAWCSEEV